MKTTFTFEDIQVTPLLKAFSKFESFRTNLHTEQEQAGAIQAFEYCFELSWKTMKKILEKRGKTGNSPKEVFRLAALEGFISDPERWFYFLEMRKLTVHTYQEQEAQKVVVSLPEFSNHLNEYLKVIGANDSY